MRIIAGSSSEQIYFVAYSSVAASTARVTGHTTAGFSVFFSKDGTTGTTAAVAFTEINSTQMPGVYSLTLLDSTLTSLPAGVDSRELCIHITGSMDAVTRTVELYRRTVTTGLTLTVNSSGEGATSLGTVVSSINNKVTSVDSRLSSMDTMLSSVNSKVTSVDTKVTSMNTQVTSILANVTSIDSRLTSMDTMLSSVNAKVTSVDTDIDTALTRLSSLGTHVDTILTRTSPNNIGAAVWDAQTTAYRVLGSFGQRNYVEIRGVAADVTSDSITLDSSGSTTDGVYQNSILYIGTSADHVGQARYITNHTSALVTVSPAFIPTPSTPISYYIAPAPPALASTASVALSTADHEAIAHAVWDEQTSSHATAGTFGKSVADNLTKVTSIDSRLSSMDTMLTSVNSKVTSVDSRLSSMDTMLSSVNSKVTSVDSRLTSMDTMLSSVNSKVTSIDSVVSSVNSKITSVDSRLSSMDTMLSSVNSKVTSVDSRLTSMDTMLSSVNSKVTSVDTKVTSINTQVTSIDSRLSSMDTMLTSVNAKVTSADSNIALVKAETTAIKAQTDNLTFTQAGKIDANIHYVNNVQVQGTGSTTDTWRPV